MQSTSTGSHSRRRCGARNKFKRTSAKVEQVWFPGVHADIGGGYEQQDSSRALDDLAMDWLIKRLRKHFPDFPATAWPSLPEQAELGPQHDSRSRIYKAFRRAVRSIGNRPLPPLLIGWRDVCVGQDPHAKAVNEAVHIYAIRCIGTEVRIGDRTALYAPANLLCCLPDLWDLYSSDGPVPAAADILGVAAMDGNVVEPGSDAAHRVFEELRAAGMRLQRQAPSLLEKIPWVLPER